MSQYMLSVWHDTDYEVDFSSDEMQRTVAQVSAYNDELQAAGAYRIYDDPADLLRFLDEVGVRPAR